MCAKRSGGGQGPQLMMNIDFEQVELGGVAKNKKEGREGSPRGAAKAGKEIGINKQAIAYMTLIYSLLLTFIFLFTVQTQTKAQAQSPTQAIINREGLDYPIPPDATNRMFFLQRTPNTNTIACDLNMNSKGEVNTKVPLTTYWLRYGDSPKGEKKELSFIQRHFAYGLNIKARGDNKYEFWFVSYKKYHMYLLQTKDGKWRVYGKINDKLTVLGSIFINIKGGTFWNPHVVYVELRGKDINNGKIEVQRLTDVVKDPDNGHDKQG